MGEEEQEKFSSNVERIGPEKALELLTRHPKNRKLSQARVRSLARAMTEGRWVFDGQPIRIDTTGSLVDGQHRLNAVIESETEHSFLVVRGVEAEAMTVMDSGKSRTFADVLQIEDKSIYDATALAAAVRVIYLWEQGLRGRSLSGSGNQDQRVLKATPQVMLPFFREHKEALIETSKTARADLRRYHLPINGSALALAKWVLTNIDQQDAEFFIERLGDGVGLEADAPVYALRKRFREYEASRERLATHESAALIFKAWNYYRQGKKVQVLGWKQGGAHPEAFPEPK